MSRPTYQGVRRLTAAQIRAQRVRARVGAWRDRRIFDAVERFCLFIGYARSGHTVLASILDAHPDAVVANELDAVGFLEQGFTRRQLLHMILTNARETHAAGNEWTGYSYAVPGGLQGRVRTARVMGDKKAGVTARRLGAQPELLARLRAEMGVPLRLVHVVRNPFDQVVARHRHNAGTTMRAMLDSLGALYDAVETIRTNALPGEILDLRSEDLIAAPETALARVLDFLDLPPEGTFLADAASIVFRSPSRRRDSHDWTADERAELTNRIARHDFLAGYTFED